MTHSLSLVLGKGATYYDSSLMIRHCTYWALGAPEVAHQIFGASWFPELQVPGDEARVLWHHRYTVLCWYQDDKIDWIIIWESFDAFLKRLDLNKAPTNLQVLNLSRQRIWVSLCEKERERERERKRGRGRESYRANAEVFCSQKKLLDFLRFLLRFFDLLFVSFLCFLHSSQFSFLLCSFPTISIRFFILCLHP